MNGLFSLTILCKFVELQKEVATKLALFGTGLAPLVLISPNLCSFRDCLDGPKKLDFWLPFHSTRKTE